jgi:Pyruvate/2-oxoglutarate dehydrogenase complex, dihydrolipoamide dehydrogenase (E3) component, and related enzymes
MELSTAFAKLGADVTVVEALDEALTGYEDDVTRAVRDGAAAAGVEVRLGERAVGLAEADGAVLETETDGGTERYPADAVLVAVGRDPVTNTVNLDAVGLTPEPDGSLAVDETCRTDAEGVFAVGDVAGDPMLAHRAYREGAVAAAVAAGDPEAVDDRAVPAAVFTDPEVATVGLTADEARDAGYEPAVGEMPFRASGRALTTGHSDGFARVVADAETGVVLGGQVVGREASELIAVGDPRRRDGRDARRPRGDGPRPPDADRGGPRGRRERPRRGDSHPQPLSRLAGDKLHRRSGVFGRPKPRDGRYLGAK